VELIRCGVTTFNDMYFFPDVTAKVISDCGLKAAIGIPILPFPSAWASSPDEYLQKGLKVREEYKDHPRVHFVFAPHAPYTVDDPTYLKIKDLAEKEDSRIHIHVHETKSEVEDAVSSSGVRPIERLYKLGVLNHRMLTVHMTQLNDEDIDIVAKSGAHVIRCPESNLKLGSGICPVSKLLSKGVNVCLGTDGPASNDDVSLLGEMRTSSLVDKYRVEDPPVPAYHMLQMGTLNGAKALGLEKRIGSLEVGKDADIVALKLLSQPVYNPINIIVYVETNRIDYVWVDGKLLLDDGKITTLDVPSLVKEAHGWKSKIVEWDEERKKADITKLKSSLTTLLEGINDKLEPTKLEEILRVLGGHKDTLFHWTFFAKRGDLIGATEKEVEEISKEVAAHIATVEGLLKK